MRGRAVDVLGAGASAVLGASAFLPWMRMGDIGLRGVPDPAGYFVLALGALGVLLAAASLAGRRAVRQWLFLVGLAGVTTLAVVWKVGPSTIAARAQAQAQAVALVDNVALQPPPPVTMGAGLLVGLIASAVVAGTGLISREFEQAVFRSGSKR
jgi:hypothetical protein